MTEELYINNKDAWLNWNVRLIEDSFQNLLLSANPKKYVENKNRSEHGTRLIVSDPRIDERNVQLMFGITCNTIEEYLEKYESFINELNNGWIELKVIPLKKVYNLVEPEFLNLGTGVGIRSGKLSVRFREPNPDNRSIIRFYTALSTQDSKMLQTQDNKVVIK